MNYRNILLLMSLSVLFQQCAKQTQPTGGPKDEIPPKLIESDPVNRKTNFTKDEINLTFNEAIQINNAREQIVITPSIGKKFEVVAKKNKATLKLNAELQENTTYTISFRESIQDLTEKNSVENLKLAFSTGEYIDSLSISGNVYNLLEGKPVKNFTVAAVPNNDTTDIFKHEARWITFTNDKGEYSLENLKAGQYILYAFEDKNKNLVVESKTELYGFIGEPIQLDSSNVKINIPVIKLDTRPLKLIVAKPLSTYYNIRLSKGFSTYTLTDTTGENTLYSIPDDESTIKIYNTLTDKDSIAFNFHVTDSIKNTIDTVLYLKFEKRTTTKDKFTTKIDEIKFSTSSSILRTLISFNKPVAHANLDSIFIQLDSVNFIRYNESNATWNQFNSSLILEKKLPKETDFSSTKSAQRQQIKPREDEKIPSETSTQNPVIFNELIIRANTFVSVEKDSSTATKSSINTIKPEGSGILFVDVQTTEKIILQILDRSKKVVQESLLPKTRFENLIPGDYQVRLILDKNENSKWDPGNFYLRQEPEPIVYYVNEKGISTITIKANWEVGPLLITP